VLFGFSRGSDHIRLGRFGVWTYLEPQIPLKMTATSGDNGASADKQPDASEKKPDNIVFMVIPTAWRDRIKAWNKNVSQLRFVKNAETPAAFKCLFAKLDAYFLCTERGSSVGLEIVCGCVSFVSCMFLLAVVPAILAGAGYDVTNSTAAVCVVYGLGNFLSGVFSNLPVIIGPSTPVTAYFAASVQSSTLSVHQANMVVVYTGIMFLIMGVVAPIGRFFARTVPEYIQLSTTIGVGLVSTLSGVSSLGLVRRGTFSLLEFGTLDAKSIIGLSTILVIAISIMFKSKVSHIRGLVWGTFIWWASQKTWPSEIAHKPYVHHDTWTTANNGLQIELIFEIFFLLLLTVFGLCKSLCTLAGIMTKENMVPNGRYLTITVAVMNLLSGSVYGPPVTVIADSSAGVRAGAKTGLTAVTAGLLFLLSIFFGPLFAAIPPTAYAPILIMTGMVQFKNIQNLDFSSRFIVPAFMCFSLIPFTNSIFAGLGIGMVCYCTLSILTGQFLIDGKAILEYYFPEYFGEEGDDTVESDGSDEADKGATAPDSGSAPGSSVEMATTASNTETASPLTPVEEGRPRKKSLHINTSDRSLAPDIENQQPSSPLATPGGTRRSSRSLNATPRRRASVAMVAAEIVSSTDVSGGDDVKGLVI
jgi:AGZA family xanthine/uracil permease-like MFS transporter